MAQLNQWGAGQALGPFLIGADGELSLRGDPARFSLECHGRRAHCEVLPAGLSLRLAAGRVPSTATGAAARPGCIEAVQWLRHSLPAGWRLGLYPDHQVVLEAAGSRGAPSRAAALLAAVIVWMNEIAPYLDLLAEEGLEKSPHSG
jgi:hypothetical protein